MGKFDIFPIWFPWHFFFSSYVCGSSPTKQKYYLDPFLLLFTFSCLSSFMLTTVILLLLVLLLGFFLVNRCHALFCVLLVDRKITKKKKFDVEIEFLIRLY